MSRTTVPVQTSPQPLSVESLTKLAGAGVILAYATGMVVVNAYLLSFGVADFSLFRARFIITGLVFLGIIFVSSGCPLVAWRLFTSLWRGSHKPAFDMRFAIRRRKPSSRSSEPIHRINEVFLSVIFLAIPVATRALLNIPLHLTFVIYFFAAVTGLLLSMAGYVFIVMRRNRDIDTVSSPVNSSRGVRTMPLWLFAAALSVFLVPYVGGTVYIFSSNVYSHIPEQFGGASPTDQVLSIKNDDVAGVRQLGIVVSHKGTTGN
ncbi:MAG: hypothetical protein H0V07_03080 [Propionibacteriales bacterium]|nr:hypothetical protein [Propionibacteriales bacterium]